MKGLLGVWQGNHDVQFVLDPYQCVTYICDYMMKSQKGMSDLLRAACCPFPTLPERKSLLILLHLESVSD